MKNIIYILLIIFLGWIASNFIDWRMTLVVPMMMAAIAPSSSSTRQIMLSFVAMFVLWFVQSYYMSMENNHLLSQRMALLFTLPNHQLLPIITGLLGGILGGAGGLCGYYLYYFLNKSKRS